MIVYAIIISVESNTRKGNTMTAINTEIGTVQVGDKVTVSGIVKESWTRTVIEVTPRYIKVVGPIKFDARTLVSRECSSHKIIGITR
jgi:hypothetical protein